VQTTQKITKTGKLTKRKSGCSVGGPRVQKKGGKSDGHKKKHAAKPAGPAESRNQTTD